MVKNQDKLLHIHVYPGVDKQEVPANRHQSVSYNKNMKLTASANGFTVADVKIMSSVQCAVRGINEELTFFFFFLSYWSCCGFPLARWASHLSAHHSVQVNVNNKENTPSSCGNCFIQDSFQNR